MPLAGLTCDCSYHGGEKLSMTQGLRDSLDDRCDIPAPMWAILQKNLSAYNNAGTVSGSSLKKTCDAKPILERLIDYWQPIKQSFYAAYRGANTHNALEDVVLNHDEFDGWLIEERFFAVLWPDNTVSKHEGLVKLASAGLWDEAKAEIAEIEREGGIVMSGQVDAYDSKNHVLLDHKTMKVVTEKFAQKKAEEDWPWQLRQYSFLLELFGHRVGKAKIQVMDASGFAIVDVDVSHNAEWVRDVLVPRVRELREHRSIQTVEEAAELAEVGFLCNGQNRDNKFYCHVRESCPAWRSYMEKQTARQGS